VADCGVLLPYSVRNARGMSVAAKPALGRPRRFGSVVGCANCPAVLTLRALAQNSLRALTGDALLGASWAHRGLPCTVFAPTVECDSGLLWAARFAPTRVGLALGRGAAFRGAEYLNQFLLDWFIALICCDT